MGDSRKWKPISVRLKMCDKCMIPNEGCDKFNIIKAVCACTVKMTQLSYLVLTVYNNEFHYCGLSFLLPIFRGGGYTEALINLLEKKSLFKNAKHL